MSSGDTWSPGLLNDNIGFIFEWTIPNNGQSIENNETTIRWSFRTTGSTTKDSWTAGPITLTIDGVKVVTVTGRMTIYGAGKTSWTGTSTIEHNKDGTKKLPVSIKAAIAYTYINYDESTTFNLDPIPKASTLSVSAGKVLVSQKVKAVVANNYPVTHTLIAYTNNEAYKEVICTKSNKKTWTYTPPLDLLTDPSAMTTYIRLHFKLTTYDSNGTEVGYDTDTVTINFPDSDGPTCALTITDPDNHVNTYGGYIQNVSRIGYVVDATPVEYSTISSYSVKIGNLAAINTASGGVSGYPNAGRIQIKATVTDSLGGITTVSDYINVLEYSSPSIPLLTASRCTSDGTDSATGNCIKVIYSYNITTLGDLNSKNITLKYVKNSTGEANTITLDSLYIVDQAVYIIENVADDSSYDITLSVADAFITTTSTTKASSSFCIFHVPASGQGISFGGVSETINENRFNVMMPAHFYNGLTQDVIELNNVDYDYIMISGLYHITGVSSADSGDSEVYCKHFPFNSFLYAPHTAHHIDSWLEVMAYEDHVYQRCVNFNGEMYYRLRYYRESKKDYVWTDWVFLNSVVRFKGTGTTADPVVKVRNDRNIIGFTFNTNYRDYEKNDHIHHDVIDIQYLRASKTLSLNISFDCDISLGTSGIYIGELTPNIYAPWTDTDRVQLSINSSGGHAYITGSGRVYAKFGEVVKPGVTVYISGYYFVDY